MERKMADCRRFESETDCSLTIIGEEEEVLETAMQHAASVHGHEDSAETREAMRGMLEPESAYSPGAREKEPMPG